MRVYLFAFQILLIIWQSTLLETWKIKQLVLSVQWGTRGFNKVEDNRIEFRGGVVRKQFLHENDCKQDLMIHSNNANSTLSDRENVVNRKLKKLWGREYVAFFLAEYLSLTHSHTHTLAQICRYLDRHVTTSTTGSTTVKRKNNDDNDKSAITKLETYLASQEQRLCGSTFKRISSKPKYPELQVGALNREEWGSECYFNATVSAQRVVLSESELKECIDSCNNKTVRLGSRVNVFQSKLGTNDDDDDESDSEDDDEVVLTKSLKRSLKRKLMSRREVKVSVPGVVEELEIPSKLQQWFCCAQKKWTINFPKHYELVFTKVPRPSDGLPIAFDPWERKFVRICLSYVFSLSLSLSLLPLVGS